MAAQSTATVIILMAVSKLESIMEIFAQYGKSETPVAIIQDGTTAKEKMVSGTVRDIAYRSQYAGLCNPAIIIIGEVVNGCISNCRCIFSLTPLNSPLHYV